jgi:hypothetical protein
MEDDVLWDDAKLCQLSKITNISKASLTKELFLFASLKASKLLIKIIDQTFDNVWHIPAERSNKPRVRWKEVTAALRDFLDRLD